MNSNYDQQKDEIDLLTNILFDKLVIKTEIPNYSLEIITKGNVDEPRMEFFLTIKLEDQYPNSPPIFTLVERNNYLHSQKLKTLINQLNELCNEYTGIPVVYQLYETVQTFADDEENAYINEQNQAQFKIEEEQRKYEAKLKEEEDKLLANKTYTPVTVELFNEWYENFAEEQYAKKRQGEQPGIETRMTGREIFMNKKIKIDLNGDEDYIETEVIIDKDKEKDNQIDFNPDAFEEDIIDDIDFEQDDKDIENIDDI